MYYNVAEELLSFGRHDKIAFIDNERSISYEELNDDSNRFAHFLQKHKINCEERIACIMHDTVDYPVIMLGAIKAGVIPVLINTLLQADQYLYMLNDSRAKALFISPQLFNVVEPILHQCEFLKEVIVIDEKFHKALGKFSDRFAIVKTHKDEVAFWLYSSGSTGNPKGTKHLHGSPMATAELYGKNILGLHSGDTVFSVAKLFFAYGLGNSLFFPMTAGATSILNPDRPTPALAFDFMEKYQPSVFYGVPTLYAAMLGDKSLENREGSKALRLCTSAGEALPKQIGQAFKKRFGVDIIDGLGSTEMLHIFLSNTVGDIEYGTTGRPVKGYNVKLLSDDGELVSQGEIGELYVNGPTAAEGYWNQRDKTRTTFQGEWVKTGDKYLQNENGRYVYCGRADDMFKVSGIWLSPFEVEGALITHESVLEAAVVSYEDHEKLVKPRAFVVLKEGFKGDKDALKTHVKGKIGLYKYPREIEFVKELPKTATGKIQRFKLR